MRPTPMGLLHVGRNAMRSGRWISSRSMRREDRPRRSSAPGKRWAFSARDCYRRILACAEINESHMPAEHTNSGERETATSWPLASLGDIGGEVARFLPAERHARHLWMGFQQENCQSLAIEVRPPTDPSHSRTPSPPPPL